MIGDSRTITMLDKSSDFSFRVRGSSTLTYNAFFELVCMFDKFRLMFNFNSKVSRDVLKNKNECQLTSTFSSKMSAQCYMPSSTCHFNF